MMAENPEAPRDVGFRTVTRLTLVFGLSGGVPGDWPADQKLTEVFRFGRFARHVDAAAVLLPRPILSLDIGSALELPSGRQGLSSALAVLMATPRGDAALVLDGLVPEGADSPAVAGLLGETCFGRSELRLHGKPILDALVDSVEPENCRRLGPLRFGGDVHQCVFPGGDLLAAIRAGKSYWPIVYRVEEPLPPGRAEQTGIFRPALLNYQDATVVGHGRGVSVLAGWGEPVENGFGLIAIMLVTAMGVLHRARLNAFDAMTQGGAANLISTADARTLITRLSAQLNELQLDLFGVEAYLDSVLIPELIIESFQRSLRDALGLSDGLNNTSRMLGRLDSVLQARLANLQAAVQEQAERRDRILSGMLAAGTLIALPPALLLAFFGVNASQVDSQRSIFEIRSYWGAYILAWIPFVVLVMVGFALQRRIRARSGQVRIYDETVAEAGKAVRIEQVPRREPDR
jgi:hypothetical protein